MKQWYLIENADEYAAACLRYEQVREAAKGSEEHREKMLLALLISTYEEKQWNAPDLDPIELIKIRMEEFGYTASDLAKVYGDKGTVSKVLHYKQALSLTMIRKFSNFLRIPPEALTREYSLIGQA
ncbi:MAG: helix-turn-helix domain-containing protein [Sphingobacteriales bacterium]|jgi:HTH-type transcriptional regulator/antitoxin HigA|nr:helix-turn-helix domain-containing protein [Chitinophagaceae bacterium]MBN8862835.1 helix-turn-helix domain-containing protein [Sphingobacteriales bacterium]NCT75025.1 helix-turn-helix domain-containing protein [Chitinophagaceae bacterium]OJW31953.1 MAG: XRE family transcriptional regulator [Sphingobacteriales bacterium 46-32]